MISPRRRTTFAIASLLGWATVTFAVAQGPAEKPALTRESVLRQIEALRVDPNALEQVDPWAYREALRGAGRYLKSRHASGKPASPDQSFEFVVLVLEKIYEAQATIDSLPAPVIEAFRFPEGYAHPFPIRNQIRPETIGDPELQARYRTHLELQRNQMLVASLKGGSLDNEQALLERVVAGWNDNNSNTATALRVIDAEVKSPKHRERLRRLVTAND